jgi:hypothetical protein
LYLAEGIRLSGSVLEQWTSTYGNSRPPSYHVIVLYEAPGGGMYVKNFKATRYEQFQANIQLIILPQYPASAIQYSTIDPLKQWSSLQLTRNNYLAVFFVRYGFRIQHRPHVLWWAVALIIVCEVCISFVGVFLTFPLNHHDEVQKIMFNATPNDESTQELQQPRPSMPQITYQQTFPHGTFTFCSQL